MNKSKIWVGTSWKMNKTLAEAQSYARALADADNQTNTAIQRFVIPSFTALREVKQILQGSSVKVGAQNMHWSDEGAWTGEVSPVMLTDCALDLVELGHSERREHFGETDVTVGLKVEAAMRHGLIPLICVGETLAERDAGRAEAVLETQVVAALEKIADQSADASVLLAYEPVWAIGDKGIPASADYASARQAHIIATARSVLGKEVPCLYGGSVNLENCEELIKCPHIDGLFIGRSAWHVGGYLEILRRCAASL